MELSPFPGCCGINILWRMGLNLPEGDHTPPPTKEEIYDLVHEAREYNHKGYVMLTLSSQQRRDGVEKPVLQAGFKLMEKFRNPNSNHDVYVYGRKTTGLPRKKEVKREESAPVQERGPQTPPPYAYPAASGNPVSGPLVPRGYGYGIPAQQAGVESARGVTSARGE